MRNPKKVYVIILVPILQKPDRIQACEGGSTEEILSDVQEFRAFRVRPYPEGPKDPISRYLGLG